eukprot:COSAG05_NODE_3214_length_2238_cov_1.702197_1_plen_419_part_10
MSSSERRRQLALPLSDFTMATLSLPLAATLLLLAGTAVAPLSGPPACVATGGAADAPRLLTNSSGWCVTVDTTAPIVLGSLLPSSSSSTAALLAAMRLAVEDINADMSVLPNSQLVLAEVDMAALRNATDSAATQQAAVAAAAALTSAGAAAAVGAPFSSDVFALADPVHAAGIPLVSISATHAALSNTAQYPGFARLIASDSAQIAAMVAATQQMGWARISIIRCNDVYCVGLANAVMSGLMALGLAVDFEHELIDGGDAAGSSNATTAVDALDAWHATFNNTDCVSSTQAVSLLLMHVAHAESLMQEVRARDNNLPIRFLGTEAVSTSTSTLISGVLAVRPRIDLTTFSAVKVLSRLEQQAGFWPLFAYDSIWALALAMDKANSEGAGAASGPDILSAMANLSFAGASGIASLDHRF